VFFMHSQSLRTAARLAQIRRQVRLGVALALPLVLALIISACDQGGAGGATPGAARVHVTATPSRFVPDPPEQVETTAAGALPAFVNGKNVSAKVPALYQGARDHSAEYSQIPCYCGCAIYQHPHSSLLSCFIKEKAADGSITWTDHSTSCNICTSVAEMTLAGLTQGTPLAQIRDLVHEKHKYTGVWTDTPPIQ
jgi:hypothetical protein